MPLREAKRQRGVKRWVLSPMVTSYIREHLEAARALISHRLISHSNLSSSFDFAGQLLRIFLLGYFFGVAPNHYSLKQKIARAQETRFHLKLFETGSRKQDFLAHIRNHLRFLWLEAPSGIK